MYIRNTISYNYMTFLNSSSGLVSLSSPPSGFVLYNGDLDSNTEVYTEEIEEGLYSISFEVSHPAGSYICLYVKYIDPDLGSLIGVIRQTGVVIQGVI